MRPSHLAAFLLLACAPPRAAPGGGETAAPDPPADTDHGSVLPVDTDPSDDPEQETGRDTPVLPFQPPASWGGGFVDVSGPLLTTDAFLVDPGDPISLRWPQSTFSQWVDLDGDGAEEVVVGQGPSPTPVDHLELRAYRFAGGALVPVHETVAALGVPSIQDTLALVDLDGDGHLDALGGGEPRLVRWGSTEGWGPWEPAHGGRDDIPGRAVGLLDLDTDGWLDMIVGGTCARPSLPVLRTGPRTWTARPDLLPPGEPPASAGAFLPAVTSDGRTFIYMVGDSHACDPTRPHPGFYRVGGRDPEGFPRLVTYEGVDDDAWWTQLPQAFGYALSQLAPMGSAVGDLDGDEHLDLIVTIALRPQAVLTGRGDGTFEDAGLERAIVVPPSGVPIGQPPWAVAILDLDRDGRADVVTPKGDDATSYQALAGTPFTTSLWWNAGAGRFVDVGAQAGLGALGSWRGLSLGDPDADGDADLIVGGLGNGPRVYRNDVSLGRGFSLVLRGSTSNPLAVGARVEVEVAGLPVQRAQVGATGNFDGWTGSTLFFATGAAEAADRVRVTWPSGYVQTWSGLAAGTRHVLDEARTVLVDEADRHLPADGRTTTTVRVTPRHPDGSLDAAAAVTVAALGGGAAVANLVPLPDGTWVAVLRAPPSPGSTRVRVTIDGRSLAVEPRLWWDAVP